MILPDTVFWDFDGVIKESIEVKTQAFVQLFGPFGRDVVSRVRVHHLSHGGMSRYKKIPLYLEWTGTKYNPMLVNDLCDQFGQLVMQGVINAPWVPGIEHIFHSSFHRHTFFLVSATPQNELLQILHALGFSSYFKEVYGAPYLKEAAIRLTLEKYELNSKDCLMIGDSREDFAAAQANKVPFLLRRHIHNSTAFQDYSGDSVCDFLGFSV